MDIARESLFDMDDEDNEEYTPRSSKLHRFIAGISVETVQKAMSRERFRLAEEGLIELTPEEKDSLIDDGSLDFEDWEEFHRKEVIQAILRSECERYGDETPYDGADDRVSSVEDDRFRFFGPVLIECSRRILPWIPIDVIHLFNESIEEGRVDEIGNNVVTFVTKLRDLDPDCPVFTFVGPGSIEILTASETDAVISRRLFDTDSLVSSSTDRRPVRPKQCEFTSCKRCKDEKSMPKSLPRLEGIRIRQDLPMRTYRLVKDTLMKRGFQTLSDELDVEFARAEYAGFTDELTVGMFVPSSELVEL